MKNTHIFFMLFLLLQARTPNTNTTLYPFNKSDRWGFIDANGSVIIQPLYRSVQPFYEGLAAVRKEGYYGYIDKDGKVVIPFKYDYAGFFQDGLARVFIDGKPFYINKAGKIQFEHNYKSIGYYGDNGLAEVQTYDKHIGFIDRSGNLVLDTMYSSCYGFRHGFAVIYGINHDEYAEKPKKPVYEVGLIDNTGQFTIGFGRFRNLEYFSPGMYRGTLFKKVRTAFGSRTEDVIVDSVGNILFADDDKNWTIYGESFNEGLCEVHIPFPKRKKKASDDDREDYSGIINTKGELLFSDTTWTEITPFSNSRAFVLSTDSKWRLINQHGQIVDSTGYDQIITYSQRMAEGEKPFIDGRSFVRMEREQFFIDINGKKLTDVPAINFDYEDLSQQGSYLIFKKSTNEMHVNRPPLIGYFNMNTGQLVEPSFVSLDEASIGNELMQVVKEDSWGYIDQQGKMRWETAFDKSDTMQVFDSENMTRGYYYAASSFREELNGFGGWGHSANQSRQLEGEYKKSSTTIELLMNTNDPISWSGLYSGFRTYLNNTTSDTFFFEAQDSRLYIKMQAKDKKGNWRDIEYLPSSWCGNSYHQVYLAPGEYWQFKTPLYHGEFQTQLRLELVKCYRKGPKQYETIYSNTINASINPAQFWKKGTYQWGGIMDPYWE